MPHVDRRAFLLSTLAGPLATAVAQRPERRIIDTHQHLWNRKKFRLAWIPKGTVLDRDYGIKEYHQAVKGLGVVAAVYMEVDVDPAQQRAEAEDVLALCKKGDTLTRAAVISGRPAADDFPASMRRFKDHPHLKGVRQVLHGAGTPPGYCLQKSFIRGIRLLGELGLSYDLCMRHAELPDAGKLIDACPSTRFILDHCGNPDLKKHDRWKKDLADLARRKNLVCKVSGIVASAPPGWKVDDLAPVVRHTLDVFGPDRVMFASDWPVCLRGASLARWVETLEEIVAPRKAEEQRKLFHDNAARFYGLDRKGGS